MSTNITQQLPAQPRKRSSAAPKAKTPKPAPRSIEHKVFGRGVLRSVRQVDSGTYVAEVEFGDGATRVICLDQPFWLTDISDLLAAPPKPSRRNPVPVQDNDARTTGEGQEADSLAVRGEAETLVETE